MRKLTIVLAAGIAALMVDTALAQQRSQPQQYRQGQMYPQQQHQRYGAERRGAENGDRMHRDRDRGNRSGKNDDRLLQAIEEADSVSKLRRYLQQAAGSRSEDVRLAMVNALESADKHSPSDFAYFIADSSEEVADAAFSAWTSAMEEVKGERRARAILETAEILRGSTGGFRQEAGRYPYRASNASGGQPGAVPPMQPGTAPAMQPGTVPAIQPGMVPSVR